MRVLQVTNSYPPADLSGVGTLVFELARELERQGHEAIVLTRQAPAGDQAAVAIGGSKSTFPLRAAWRFLRLSRRQPFDVVHVHESDGALVAWLHRRARRWGWKAGRARLFATLQVSYVREKQAVRAVRANGRVVSLPTVEERRFARWRAPILARLGRLSARLADRVVAPSEATARELEADYGVANVAVIPNGVAARPIGGGGGGGGADRRRPGGPVRFISVGRLRSRKAVAVLLEAYDLLRRRRDDVELVVVGSGEQEQAIAAQALRLGTPGLCLVGSQPRERALEWMAGSDVFCLASTYEGFPLAILEAMSLGLPVIATRVAGNPEAVEHLGSGLLVDAEDAEGLCTAMEQLAADPALRSRMGQRGRELLSEKYDITHITRAHLGLWQGAAQGRGRSET
jgi:glycosyltransferase involved in cell wall biosynthesis